MWVARKRSKEVRRGRRAGADQDGNDRLWRNAAHVGIDRAKLLLRAREWQPEISRARLEERYCFNQNQRTTATIIRMGTLIVSSKKSAAPPTNSQSVGRDCSTSRSRKSSRLRV